MSLFDRWKKPKQESSMNQFIKSLDDIAQGTFREMDHDYISQEVKDKIIDYYKENIGQIPKNIYIQISSQLKEINQINSLRLSNRMDANEAKTLTDMLEDCIIQEILVEETKPSNPNAQIINTLELVRMNLGKEYQDKVKHVYQLCKNDDHYDAINYFLGQLTRVVWDHKVLREIIDSIHSIKDSDLVHKATYHLYSAFKQSVEPYEELRQRKIQIEVALKSENPRYRLGAYYFADRTIYDFMEKVGIDPKVQADNIEKKSILEQIIHNIENQEDLRPMGYTEDGIDYRNIFTQIIEKTDLKDIRNFYPFMGRCLTEIRDTKENLINYLKQLHYDNPEEFTIEYINKFHFSKGDSLLHSLIKNNENQIPLTDILECYAIDLPNYELLGKIGSGATATTYKVKSKDSNLAEGEYVLKIFNEDKINIDEVKKNNLIMQFPKKDAMHLADIINAGYIAEVNGEKKYCLLMHYDGNDLSKTIKQGRIEIRKSLKYFDQIMEAVEVLNKHNLFHRDIRPQNIFVKDDFVTIGDFGIAIDNESFEYKDNRRYRAPENYKGESPDIFSAGLVLYEMITGEHLILNKDLDMNTEEYANQVLEMKNNFYTSEGEINPLYLNRINKKVDNFPKCVDVRCLLKECLECNTTFESIRRTFGEVNSTVIYSMQNKKITDTPL